MPRPLMDTGTTDDIHIIANIVPNILLRQPSTNLHERRPWPPAPFLLDLPRRPLHLLRREIVQHDHVRTRLARRIRFLKGLALYLDLDREARRCFCCCDGRGDRAAARPDVVVLQHRHGR